MRVDTLAEDKSGGLLCLHMYLRLGNEGEHQGKNQEALRLGLPWGPVGTKGRSGDLTLVICSLWPHPMLVFFQLWRG